MTISELIEELEKIKEKHGDIDVEYQGYTLLDSSDISEVYVETRNWKSENENPVMYVVIA